jgi:predicted GNAT family acetyltransferase
MGGREDVVRDNPDERWYELLRDGELEGEIRYRVKPVAIVLLHTEVAPSAEGQGLGGRLVAGALPSARAGSGLVPVRPFVAAYIRRHHP